MKITLGRTDIVDFPKLKLFDIPVKIDTGAFTSSLHCHKIEIEDQVLKCQLLDPEHEMFHDRIITFDEFYEKTVKSSNGMAENRIVVSTEIILFDKVYPIEINLTERSAMKFPVLLGRNFLSRKFIVDTSRTNLSYKHKIKSK